MKQIYSVFLILFLVFGMETSLAAAPSDDVGLSFTSELLSDGDVVLHVELQYRGSKPVFIYKSDLPWGIRRSLLLVGVCLDATKSVMSELNYIDDPSPGILELKPGQKLGGTISLKQRFPSLPECLRVRDALIFWSYQLSPTGSEKSFARTFGGLAIKRNNF